MMKLMSFLKKYSLQIAVLIALLFAQAALELALPDYMSKIVNVGIQQGGIESPYPDVIRESEVTLLENLMTEEETIKFRSSYALLGPEDNDLLKKYPNIESEPVYGLREEIGADSSLSYLNPYLLMMYGLRDVKQAKLLVPGGDFSKLPAGVSPIVAISRMPEEEKRAFVDKVLLKLSVMPETAITQTAALYTRGEYDALGADLSGIQTNYVLMAGLQMIGIAFLALLVSVIVSFIASRVSAYLGRDLRSSLFRKVASFSNEEYNDFSTASLITRSTNDIQQVQMFSVLLLRMVFFAPILGVGGIIKALNTNKSMAWVIAVGVMAILTIVVIMFSIAMPKFKSLQKLVDKVNMVVRDSLVGLMVIRAFNTERYEEKKFDVANKDLTRINLFVSRLMSMMQPLMMLILNALGILIIWVGSYQVDYGNMQVGDMMAYIQYTMQIMMAFLMLSMVSIILPRATVSMNRISEVLDKEVSILDPESPKQLPLGVKGEIEFRDVSFKYPGAEDYVLKDISFKANYGQTTAFIGSTGSGKSTLVNLIPRFYDVTKGEILLNRVNIKEIPLKELRKRISYVPQKGILFSGTAETNIKYADEDMSDEKMKKAARISQAEDFINEKENKFDFSISQGGSNVSGGQRQRLSIARALATDAEAIIFDDSFSALDYKTDSKLRATLKKEVNNTVIIVAQRISTIKTADRIIVLDEGRIVGQGTHKELLEDCPVYIEIAESQLSKEEMAS